MTVLAFFSRMTIGTEVKGGPFPRTKMRDCHFADVKKIVAERGRNPSYIPKKKKFPYSAPF